jgi:tRNA-(ms[2]io[6]A)-hydroxylase
MARRGWVPRTDTPNHYARALLAEVRGREPERLLDALLVAAFIEARSHERLGLLAAGFARGGDAELADFYAALADAEERHAEIFLDLARPLVSTESFEERLEVLAARETEVLAELPHTTRVH